MPINLREVGFIINPDGTNRNTIDENIKELSRFARLEGFSRFPREEGSTKKTKIDKRNHRLYISPDSNLKLTIYTENNDGNFIEGKVYPLYETIPVTLNSNYVEYVEDQLREQGFEFKVKHQV